MLTTARVFAKYKGQKFSAEYNPLQGTVLMDGHVYPSPTAAAMKIKNGIPTNGQIFWRSEDGTPIKKAFIREACLKNHRGGFMKDKNKNPGGRPKRFEGDFGTVSIQLPHDLVDRFEAAAHALGMSKSRFGQYLFEKWIEENELKNTKKREAV